MEIAGGLIIDVEGDRAIFMGSVVPMLIAGKPADIGAKVVEAAAKLRAYLEGRGISFEQYVQDQKDRLAERGRLY